MTNEVITKLEKQTGLVATDEKLLPNTTKPDEFIEHALNNGFIGFNYEDRVKFLKANGYEVTRENIVNAELSAKPQD